MNYKANRFAQLARLGEVVFHTSGLASLWRIKDSNTLYTTLKRYTQRGLLFRVYKGLYSLKPVVEIDPWLLGVKVLHKYTYISTETILSQAGIILQNISYVTLISSQSRRFTVASRHYYCRQLAAKYLHNQSDVREKNGVYIASVERAVADLLYFNPRVHLDAPELVDWIKVKKIQQAIGYPIKKYE